MKNKLKSWLTNLMKKNKKVELEEELELSYLLAIFRSSGRLFIIPFVPNSDVCYHLSNWGTEVSNIESVSEIGDAVNKSLEHIRNFEYKKYSAKDLSDAETWKKFTKHKTWKKFLLNSTEICFMIKDEEDKKNDKNNKNDYLLAIEHRYELDRHYSYLSEEDDDKKIELPLTASPEEIGRAVIEVLDAGDKIYNINTRLKDGPVVEPEPFPMLETYIFHDYVLNYKTPEFDGICDHGEKYHSEIFRCFTYKRESDKSDIASIVIGAAINFTSEFTEDDAKNMLEKYYKNSNGLKISKEKSGIFTHKLDVRNEKIRMITYFLNYADEFLLDCEMIVHNPFENKELVKEFEIVFEKFVKGIKISKEV